MPPVKLTFYTSGLRPPRSADLPAEIAMPTNAALFMGTEGKMLVDFSKLPILLPTALAKANLQPKEVLPRGADHWTQWRDAVMGRGNTCGSNFDYAAGLTEMVLLGTIAASLGRRKHAIHQP